MSSIAIIPARGGSKRIPRKNIKKFLGKPIIAYSIEAAIQSDLFDEVMVSTDDEEIAEVAKEYGATVPFMRSGENSGDLATTIDVLLEVIRGFKTIKHKDFSYACCIYPTAPLIQAEHLSQGFSNLIKPQVKAVFPVVSFSYPIWRGFEVDSDNGLKLLWPEYLNSRSQDLNQVYHDAGQWYWFEVLSFLSTKEIFTKATRVVKLDEFCVQDIDNESDWKLAELKYKLNFRE